MWNVRVETTADCLTKDFAYNAPRFPLLTIVFYGSTFALDFKANTAFPCQKIRNCTGFF